MRKRNIQIKRRVSDKGGGERERGRKREKETCQTDSPGEIVQTLNASKFKTRLD